VNTHPIFCSSVTFTRPGLHVQRGMAAPMQSRRPPLRRAYSAAGRHCWLRKPQPGGCEDMYDVVRATRFAKEPHASSLIVETHTTQCAGQISTLWTRNIATPTPRPPHAANEQANAKSCSQQIASGACVPHRMVFGLQFLSIQRNRLSSGHPFVRNGSQRGIDHGLFARLQHSHGIGDRGL